MNPRDCCSYIYEAIGQRDAEDQQLLRELVVSRRCARAPSTEHHTPFRLRVVVTYPC